MNDRPHLRINPESVNSRNTEFDGGGSSYRRSDYFAHGQILLQSLKNIQHQVELSNDIVKDRAFLEIRLAPGEKIKDRYKNLKNNAQINVLDVINESAAYGYIKSDDIPYLTSRLQQYAESEEHTGKSYFSFVEEFNVINKSNKISPTLIQFMQESPSEVVQVSIESFSTLPRDAQEFGFTKQIENYLNTMGEVVSSYVHSSGSVIVEIESDSKGINNLVKNLDSIHSIDITPRISLPRIESFEENNQEISIKPIEGDAKVCIFDTGTFASPEFDPYIIDRTNAIDTGYGFNTNHGSFVASRVIFRDNLEDQLAAGELTPHAKVLDIRVFGKEQKGDIIGLSESQLISTIRQTVNDYSDDIRVYNLSLGAVDPITDATGLSDVQISRIAAELDAISKEKDVLFISSAGNINSLYNKMLTMPYPEYFSDDMTRISPPGEAFLGITVGSIATKYELHSLGELNHPSPFSRRGPGSFGTLKPDIVVDGGNVTQTGQKDKRLFAVALGEQPGKLVYDIGTSFSAPLVASYAAELVDRIPDASANLIKGLLLHFSCHPQEISSYSRPNKMEHIGFGVPDLSNCLESLKSKATYVYEGSVPQQTFLKIPFWVPTILANDNTRSGRKKLRIRITLIWNPITDRRKQMDYSLTHLNLNLYKVDSDGIEREVQIPISQLIEPSYKNKFYPVIRIEKEFERNFAGGLWSIRLRLSHRWEVPDEYEQDFAVLISVEDPQDTVDVYDELLNEVGVRYEPLVRIR
ncbi:S8 family peptidase [Terribacillus saccharophilus]|uniref:S8 family peptidase n=1 Tax=Terribacillus saccharophilus TaxID=361277 RepID=UPI00380D918B